MDGHEKNKLDPEDASSMASDRDEMPVCVKPFASETARFEDEDDPCQNGEG